MRRDGEGTIVAFERQDVVWGIDPFKQDSFAGSDQSPDEDYRVTPRPWLVISTEAVPFHPEQYLCVTLTTRTWHDDSIPVSESDWTVGGAPEATSLLPWSVSAIRHEFLDTTGELVARLDAVSDDEAPDDGHQGRLKREIVNETTRTLIGYLEESLTA